MEQLRDRYHTEENEIYGKMLYKNALLHRYSVYMYAWKLNAMLLKMLLIFL